MTDWLRTTYQINQSVQFQEPPKAVRGLSNGVFGIRFEMQIGFRVTHLATGFTVSRQFFRRLKDAVSFCEDIGGLIDWSTLTVESARNLSEVLQPAVTRRAKKYHRYTLAGFTVVPLPPEDAEVAA